MPAAPRRAHRALALLCAAAAAVAGLAACTAGTVGPRGTGTPSHAGSGNSGSGAPSATSGPPPQASTAPVDFSDCSDLFDLSAAGVSSSRRRKLTIECGRVQVPADYAKPAAARLSVSVVKVHYADQPQRIGSLLVNPGGPGGSGVLLAVGLAGSLSDDILEHFDLIGFDPRGVGLSSPVTCLTDTQKDDLNAQFPNVLTAAGFAQAKAAALGVARACTSKYGARLAAYNTVETARDMDAIRAAVGDAKLNYLGFSYGTQLGAVYAHLFPTHIRVAVLDGAVDPVADPISVFDTQVKGFEDAFDQFAADCLKRPACRPLGNPRLAVYDLVEKAPLTSSDPAEKRRATGSIILTGVLSALYNQSEWPALGKALLDARGGDARGLFALADEYLQRDSNGSYTNIYDANLTISCNDEKPGPTDAQIRVTARRWARQYPMFGLWSAASLFGCQPWQPVRHVLPAVSAPGSPPILVVGTVHDPATPYRAAGTLARALGTGTVLTWNGEGHTAYGKSACIDDLVDTYLIEGTVPPAGTICPA